MNNFEEQKRQMLIKLAQEHCFYVTCHPPCSSEMDNTMTLLGMIAMRLRLCDGDRSPFDFIQAHKAAENKYFVFICQGDQAVTLEDDDLFPSDRLITQLRLIMKEGVK